MHVEISKFDIHVIHRPDTEGNGRDVRALLHERSKGEPEGVEEGVLVLVLLRVLHAVRGLLPLVRGEAGEDIDDEGDEDEDEEGVDVDVRGERVEEGKKTWRS